MSVEIKFPVEVMVQGVPLSHQASTASKEAWKQRIRDSGQAWSCQKVILLQENR